VVAIAAVQLGFPRVDYYAAWVLTSLLALMAAETLISLVLEIYRPRVKGKVGRVLYDSRSVGLLAEPEGLFTTAAHALDYQFGFKVSETWFYRFLEKALVWLVLLQLAVLFLSTSIVFISPGEQALQERFGRAVGGGEVLEPGLHLKWPWPIDVVHRYRTREIQSFNIGFVPEEEGHEEKAIVWTGKHYKEESNWLVASREEQMTNLLTETSIVSTNATGERGIPVDLVNVSVPVQFQISDLRAWAYNNFDSSNLLEKVATREVVRYLAATDLADLLGTRRAEAAEELRRRMQEQADSLQLGAKIVFVGLEDLHPPAKVAPEFEKVIGALQEIEQKRYEAEGYSNKTVILQRGLAAQMANEAISYSNRTVFASVARAGQFTNQLLAYNASPRTYLGRSYLQAVQRGLTSADKYVWATTNREDILQMNLEQKIRRDLIEDLPMPSGRK